MNLSSLSLQKIQSMPRPIRNRKILQPPQMDGFKPFGMARCKRESIEIQLDEYESIKLALYDKLSQDEAAEKMDVSRPTFTRVYNRGLEKIAKAFVEGYIIEFNGGNVEFENKKFRCTQCRKKLIDLECNGCRFQLNQKENNTEIIMK
jgi:predicted DNA-binding protein (UPF0251 family)